MVELSELGVTRPRAAVMAWTRAEAGWLAVPQAVPSWLAGLVNRLRRSARDSFRIGAAPGSAVQETEPETGEIT
jgi:hypothetical protein